MLTAEQLNAIKERAEKATAGPWEYVEFDNVIITLDDDYHFAMEVAEEVGHGFDGPFIAHAREDIPALIAEVEDQAKTIKSLRKELLRATEILDDSYELLCDSIYYDHPTTDELSEYLNVRGERDDD